MGPGDNVAVLGVGGLGHLGLKFARALGCTVTAISSSKQKEKDAKEFGAHHFLLLSDIEAMKKVTILSVSLFDCFLHRLMQSFLNQTFFHELLIFTDI